MIGKHHSGDLVRGLYIGRFFRESHLNRGRTPRDEGSQFAFSDSLKRLVNLCGVHITLDDVENRNILPFLYTR